MEAKSLLKQHTIFVSHEVVRKMSIYHDGEWGVHLAVDGTGMRVARTVCDIMSIRYVTDWSAQTRQLDFIEGARFYQECVAVGNQNIKGFPRYFDSSIDVCSRHHYGWGV